MEYRIQVNEATKGADYLQGLVTVTFGNAMKVGGIKIGEGKEGKLFIGMPNYKDGKGEYRDMCFPVTKEFREELYGNILNSFEKMKKGEGSTWVYNADSKEIVAPSVRVSPFSSSNNGVKAMATVTLNEKLVLNNISIRESKEGKLFVSYPNYKTNKVKEDGSQIYQDVFHPVSKVTRELVDTLLKDAYEKALSTEKKQDVPKPEEKARDTSKEALSAEKKQYAPKPESRAKSKTR